MVKKVHKIKWKTSKFSKEEELEFEVIDIDCIVAGVTHPCARWALGQYWHIVCTWFTSKNAEVTLGEPELIN